MCTAHFASLPCSLLPSLSPSSALWSLMILAACYLHYTHTDLRSPAMPIERTVAMLWKVYHTDPRWKHLLSKCSTIEATGLWCVCVCACPQIYIQICVCIYMYIMYLFNHTYEFDFVSIYLSIHLSMYVCVCTLQVTWLLIQGALGGICGFGRGI